MEQLLIGAVLVKPEAWSTVMPSGYMCLSSGPRCNTASCDNSAKWFSMTPRGSSSEDRTAEDGLTAMFRMDSSVEWGKDGVQNLRRTIIPRNSRMARA